MIIYLNIKNDKINVLSKLIKCIERNLKLNRIS